MATTKDQVDAAFRELQDAVGQQTALSFIASEKAAEAVSANADADKAKQDYVTAQDSVLRSLASLKSLLDAWSDTDETT